MILKIFFFFNIFFKFQKISMKIFDFCQLMLWDTTSMLQGCFWQKGHETRDVLQRQQCSYKGELYSIPLHRTCMIKFNALNGSGIEDLKWLFYFEKYVRTQLLFFKGGFDKKDSRHLKTFKEKNISRDVNSISYLYIEHVWQSLSIKKGTLYQLIHITRLKSYESWIVQTICY